MRVFFLMLTLCGTLMAGGQSHTVMSWNVENLFDCRDDSLTDDAEFLPDGERGWTPSRYWRKLDNVARTIAAVDPHKGWPPLVALMEVENDSVLHDLTRRSPLRRARYDYIMTEGPDVRGIDIALLYQPDIFRLLHHRGIRIPSVEEGYRPTRDILHATGLTPVGDTLHVLAVHLPSRSGNSRQSRNHRMLAATTLCHVLDTLHGKDILLMGDFNAEPDDEIFRDIHTRMRSLMPGGKRALRQARGTYVFQRQWSFLGHIQLTPSLAARAASHVRVAAFPFLLTEAGIPFRTYRGPAYQGGISDHLPLLLELDL